MYELSSVDLSRESALERYPLYLLVIQAIQSVGLNCLEIKDSNMDWKIVAHALLNCLE
jgi:hypothetical protein